jgi:tRNA (cytidine/uridine-2'-O-)-methyltransferase
MLAFSTRGDRGYVEFAYHPQDAFLFGPETRGLPGQVLAQIGADHTLRIPMRPGSRSLNLSNAVAVIVYEAWRSLGFLGA